MLLKPFHSQPLQNTHAPACFSSPFLRFCWYYRPHKTPPLPYLTWLGWIDGNCLAGVGGWSVRHGSIGEVSIVRRKWALGGSQHGNLDNASNNNLEHLDEVTVETNDGSATGGDTMQVYQSTNPYGKVHLFVCFVMTPWLSWLPRNRLTAVTWVRISVH